jgi:hypothetical protein
MPNGAPRVIVFGSGNVATSLGQAWEASGVDIAGFCNRQGIVPPGFTSTEARCFKIPADIDVAADYALMAVRDEVVFDLIEQLPSHLTPVHFSGAQRNPVKGGVIWCAQSIQPHSPESVGTIPMVITANEEAQRDALTALAGRISNRIFPTTEEKRQKGHLTAVFAVNFTNHALAVAQELAEQAELPWDWFVPMIEAMSRGAIEGKAHERQTGPGIRRENAIIQSQLESLRAHPDWQKFYEAATTSIQNLHDNTDS